MQKKKVHDIIVTLGLLQQQQKKQNIYYIDLLELSAGLLYFS